MQARASGVASTAFSAGTAGPYLNEILVQYASVTEATTTMAQFTQVPSSCGTVQTELGGYQMDISITAQPFPAYGDQSAALGIKMTIAGTTVSVDAQIAAVRHQATVIALTNLAIPLDPNLTSEVMATAYGDVASRW